MVFFNYSTMQMAAKIVYYGPGLCGKTTNLQFVYKKTDPKSRGEMVCLETETDRTLFFDLLPIDVGVIGGFRTRFQLYTVPGQVFYNSTRKLVLRGVDGIVFVADSQTPAEEMNLESLQNLKENLAEHNIDFDAIPLVYQFNKRDLTNIMAVDKMNNLLNPTKLPFYEASAVQGIGVFETLKGISKLTLFSLRKKALGDEKIVKPPVPAIAVPAAMVVEARSHEEKTLAGTSIGPKSPLATPPPPRAKPALPVMTKAIVEERVEFAERHVQAALLNRERITIKKIPVRSTVDIGHQLDSLRDMYTQTRAPAEKPAPHKPTVDKKLQGLLDSVKPGLTPHEIKRKTSITVPAAMVKGGHTSLVLTIRNSSNEKSQTVELPIDLERAGTKIAIKLDLDLTIT